MTSISLALARAARACTRTTFSPNIAHGGTKVNIIPEHIDLNVDIRSLPGIERARGRGDDPGGVRRPRRPGGGIENADRPRASS